MFENEVGKKNHLNPTCPADLEVLADILRPATLARPTALILPAILGRAIQ